MKKVRLSLKRRTRTWSFVLYDSAESAYFLKDEPLYSDVEDYRRVISLSPGESLELEWMGCEWVHETSETDVLGIGKADSRKFDKVRVGKITPVKSPTYKTTYLELHSGWVLSEDIPWSAEDGREDIRITPLKGRIRSKVDFNRLFEKIGGSEVEEDDDDLVRVGSTPKELLN